MLTIQHVFLHAGVIHWFPGHAALPEAHMQRTQNVDIGKTPQNSVPLFRKPFLAADP